MAAQEPLAERIQSALQMARKPLLSALDDARQRGDGGHLGLLCLAALHDGVPVDHPRLAPALAGLAELNLDQTYELALRLLVAEACATFPARATMAAADCAALLKNRDGGAFAYSPGMPWDLSNTQYAALGLRAAASIGVEIPRKVWSAMADDAFDAQGNDGGFGYRPHTGAGTASMTAAGIAVLSICRQALQRPGRTIPELDRRLAKAWKWFDKHAASIGKVDETWSFYFHYGLERAAILCDVVAVGGTDWYRRGAQMFVEQQRDDGGWATEHGMVGGNGTAMSPVDTAFAVLFLRRRFQKIAAPITPARTIVLAALSEQSTASDVTACAEGLVRRGKSAVVEILQALRSDTVQRRRAALRALDAIAGQAFGIDPEVDAEHNVAALRKAELWYLSNR